MEITIYHGPRFLTLQDELPHIEALAVADGRIVTTGPLEILRKRFFGNYRVVHLPGSVAVPGFNDNHVHAAFTGQEMHELNLTGMDSDQILAALKERFPEPRKGDILYAQNWESERINDPHRSTLDSHFPDNPVILIPRGGHGVWANSAALRLMRIGPKSKDPPGGQIIRDSQGMPTGVIREPSFGPRLFWHWAKKYISRSLIEPQFLSAMMEFNAAGITSVQDNTWLPIQLAVLKRLARRDELTLRFSIWHLGAFPPLDWLMHLHGIRDPLLTRGPLKFFLDGTFSNHSAWLWSDYADEPGNAGKGKGSAEIRKYLKWVIQRHRQAAFHAIGDRSISTFLDVLEELTVKYPEARNLRIRLEHAQLIRSEDIPRIKDLNVLICAQPHALATVERDRKFLGDERLERAYPYRALLDAGIPLSFGSDSPSEHSFQPLQGIHYAVNREFGDSISVEEALHCYTQGSAFAEFREDDKGFLSEGAVADFTVLSEDPLTCPRDRIKDIEVICTYLAGRKVFDQLTSAREGVH
jgi:predicted amidohydrolase YtcJ